MKTYTINLPDYLSEFYEKIAQNVDLPVEQVLADSLLKLAGDLSMNALKETEETPC